MIVTSEKTHTETYGDMLKQFSPRIASTQEGTAEEPTKAMGEAENSFAPPDLASPAAESFWLKLNDRLAAWLRKCAD